MGTRSMTHVVNDKGDILVSLYRQYDGYPAGGHGEDLSRFLDGAVIGNGIKMDERRAKFFNGVGDLGVRLVTHFKEDANDIGGFYLVRPGRDQDQEFTYVVTCDSGYDREGGVTVEVLSWDKSIFKGTSEDFTQWIADGGGEDE